MTLHSSRAAALAAALVASSASIARAEHASVALSYSRPKAAAGCPDEATFRGLVAARLGYDPFVADSGRSLGVEFQGRGSEIVGRLKLRSSHGEQRGERTLHARADECFELATSMALVAAVAMDPDAAQARTGAAAPPPESPKPEAPQPTVVPAAAPPPAAAPARSEAPTVERPVERPVERAVRSDRGLRLELAGLLPVGLVPAPRGGVRAGAGFELGVWSLRAEGAVLFRSARGNPAGAGEVSAEVLYGSLVPCATPVAGGPWLVDLCAVASLGAFRASARGVSRRAPTSDLFATVGPRAAVALMLSPSVGFGLGAETPVAVTRVHLDIESGAARHEVWAESRVGFIGAAFLVARLK